MLWHREVEVLPSRSRGALGQKEHILRAPPEDLAPRAGVSSKKVKWNG